MDLFVKEERVITHPSCFFRTKREVISPSLKNKIKIKLFLTSNSIVLPDFNLILPEFHPYLPEFCPY